MTKKYKKEIQKLFDNTPENTHHFFHDCIKEMRKHDVNIIISPDEYFKSDGSVYNGYFEGGEDKVFAVAIGKDFDKWFTIFIHEYSHFTQWRDDSPHWTYTPFKDFEHIDAGILLFLWAGGHIELTKEQALNYTRPTVHVEMDADKRAVELIKKYNLPVNVNRYIQTSNAYTLFYFYMIETREWYKPNKEPYRIEEIVSRMPDYFLDDYNSVDDKILDIYRRFL